MNNQIELLAQRDDLLKLREDICVDLDTMRHASALPDDGYLVMSNAMTKLGEIDENLARIGIALEQLAARSSVNGPAGGIARSRTRRPDQATPLAIIKRRRFMRRLGFALGLLIGLAAIAYGTRTGGQPGPNYENLTSMRPAAS